MSKIFRTSSSLVFASSLALFAAGCHKGPADGVVATVNNRPIQRTELDKIYDAQLAQNPQQQQTPSPDQANAARLNILHELISEEIVEQRAAKLNLTATDSEVDNKLTEMKAPFTEDQFQARLKASNRTLDDVKHDLRRSLTIDKLLNKEINSKITVTDADVATYFNAHKLEYNLIDTRYHLAGIQVSSQSGDASNNLQNSKSTSDADAKRKIEAIKNRIDAGEDFGSLAMNFSESQQTAQMGGDMGYVSDSQMRADTLIYPEILKLKAGQTTPIMPIIDPQSHKPVGYAIYKLIDKEAPGQRDLNNPAVQQSIRQQLHDSRSQLLKSAYLEMLRDQAKVENYLAEQIFKDTAK